MQRSTRFSGITFCIHAVLFLCQLFPLVIQFLLVEAGVVQFVALIPQQQVVAQDLGVVDLVFQFHDVRAQFLDLVLHGFDAGADLSPALALLFAVGLLFDCVLGFLLFLGLAVIAVLQGSKVRVEGTAGSSRPLPYSRK